MDQYIISAVIGFWRSGATLEQIMGIFDYKIKYWEIQEIIDSCEKYKNPYPVIITHYDGRLKAIIAE